jgi:arylsulfatase
LPRVNLPIADQPYSGPVAYDAKDPESVFPPIEPLGPPADAPDVLVVPLDDRDFGASSAFGGPCAAPVMERLAGGGLGDNHFHTTALCAPPDRRC